MREPRTPDPAAAATGAAELRAASDRMTLILETTGIALWERSLVNGEITMLAPMHHILGHPVAQPQHTMGSIVEWLHPDDRAAFMSASQDLLSGRSDSLEDEFRIITRDGRTRWLHRRSYVRRNDAGQPISTLGVALDVTDRKAAEVALQDADRRKNEFLAMLGHELRNPLAPLRNAAELLKRAGAADPTVERLRGVIDRQIGQLSRLVDDLLDVSRIATGRFELRRVAMDLLDAIRQGIEMSRPHLRDRRHDVTIELPQAPIPVDGDAARITQAVSNLLNNAARFTQPGGRIGLRVTTTSDQALIVVTDNGRGIAPEQLTGIFGLFVKAEAPHRHADGAALDGLGVGLMLVKGIAEMHGGHVEARSAGLGRGAEFRLTFPRLLDTWRADAATAASASAGNSRRQRVLVVDDNQDVRETTVLVLELAGHDVRSAIDGTSALALAQTFEPSVILLDIGLPDMEGTEVARRIRERAAPLRPLIIAVSGYGQEADKARSLAAGADHHLTKPVDPARLEALLTRK